MGNGAPISLLLAADSTRNRRNIDRNLRPIAAGEIPSEVAAELAASDTIVRHIGANG
jgi:hypothetical protein